MLKGKALAVGGGGLGSVKVTVTDHPEFGHTLTAADGTYNLVVNGGASLSADFELTGYMGIQRTQDVPWQTYVGVDDVVLKAFDTKVTTIDKGSTDPIQVASGNPVTDGDGTRQATLMFSKGTDATMRLPDGSTEPLGDLAVRATEFTVGGSGGEAMPGELPPSSAYTYAAEFSVDEAVAANATDVTFSKPVATYVTNFLDFPAGTHVPAAYYDEAKQAWVPAPDGVTLKILSVSGDAAAIDVTGDDVADTGAALDEWGITNDELKQLKKLYAPGVSLWRVAVRHFTPWDYNWPYGCESLCPPPKEPPPPPSYCPECQGGGSIVGLFNQTLGESVHVIGTPFELAYESDRVPGFKEAYTIRIPLTGGGISPNLERVDLRVSVAGREFDQSFPASANLKYVFTWDGKDAFGRVLEGAQLAHVQIGYAYKAVYLEPLKFARSFAQYGGAAVTGDRARKQISVWQAYDRTIGVLGTGSDALGGWTLSVHHSYDPQGKVLYLGDGSRRTSEAVRSEIETVAGNGSVGGSDGTALGTGLGYVRGVAVAADGGFYIADTENGVVRRVTPDGKIKTVAGGGSPPDGLGDGGPAIDAQLVAPSDVAVADDGTLYLSDTGNARIRRVATDGTITTIAGGGDPTQLGDDGPATAASLGTPRGIALAKDGTIYVADTGHDRVRRITPDGQINTAAGGGAPGDGLGDGGPAPSAALDHPYDVAVDAYGTLYIADGLHYRIRVIHSDGKISTLAGNGFPGSSGNGGLATAAAIGEPQGIAAASDGTVFFTDRLHHVVRKVTPDGNIAGDAGTGSSGFGGDGGPPLQARLSFPQDVSVANDGSVLIADAANHRIRRSRFGLPGFSDADISIPSEDGSELYQFNQNGRHLRTVDAITGTVRYQFGYDPAGHLLTVTDEYGNVTTIERNAAGAPTAIVAPGGQRSVLTTTGGRLTSISDPVADKTQMTYSSDGLMTSYTDPRGGVAEFAYDSSGRLIRDQNASGSATSYARTDTPHGFGITRTSELGRVTTYAVEHLPGGDVLTTVTGPTGAQSTLLYGQDGTSTTTSSDGSKVAVTTGADPRWGTLAPFVSKMVRSTPGGLTQTRERTQDVVLDSPTDPLSVTDITVHDTENGRLWTRKYVAGARTVTVTSPAGRAETLTYNANGDLIHVVVAAGTEPIDLTYDVRGRVASLERGLQTQTFVYDTANRVIERTDAAGHTTHLGYDAADRLTSLKLPGGSTYGYAYDANGNRTQITMPSGAVHTLTYDALDRGIGYRPPGSATAYTRTFDGDGKATKLQLPSARLLETSYDSGGRPMTMPEHDGATLDAQTTYSYGDPTSRVSTATRAVSGLFLTQTSFTYDGALVSGEDVVNGADAAYNAKLSYAYDDDFQLASTKLESGGDVATRALTRNADRLVTQDGPFAVTRAGTGLPTRFGDATNNLALTYDPSTRVTNRNVTVGGTSRYAVTLTRDAAGQITGRVETVAGTASTYAYTYTDDNFLKSVARNGTLVEQYAYDANGNRTSRLLSGGDTEPSTYDAQDRVIGRGAVAYQFDNDGYLKSRGADTFTYTAQGELVEATVGGTTVRYQSDTHGRRIGRTVGASRYAYFYGDPRKPYLVTAERDPAGVLTTFYYDDENVLYALVRGGTRYYVGSDQVGTPRVVTNTTGTAVKTLEYDSFGDVLSDSAPSFDLPIGFAGGLTDSLTGLVRFGWRDYDPAAGRWTARDPMFFQAPAVNLYAYVDNNPLAFRDTNGLDWSWQGIKDAVSEYGHTVIDKITEFTGHGNDNVELGHKTFDKGLEYIDTAKEVGDTYLEAQDALNEERPEKQAQGLLKCSFKWLHKYLPVDYITPGAEKALDEGAEHMDRQHLTGSINVSEGDQLRQVDYNGSQ